MNMFHTSTVGKGCGMSKENKTYVQLLSVPRRISTINEMISRQANDPRKGFLSQTCFKGMIYVKSQIVYSEPIVYLLSKWDSTNKFFVLKDGRKWQITDESVARVYGLPFGMEKMPISVDLKENEFTFVNRLLNQYGLNKKGMMIIKDLQMKEILSREDLAEPDKVIDFWRFYVLYALSSLLIPCSTPGISGRYLKFLEKPSIAKTFNWAALVRDKLIEGINLYQLRSAKTSRPTGDFYCLMHMFYDFIDSQNLAQRGFTCLLDRQLRMNDLHNSFEGAPEYPEDVLPLDFRPPSPDKPRVQNVAPVNDQIAKKQYYEKEIEECKAKISQYKEKLKQNQDALDALMKDMHTNKTEQNTQLQ